MSAVLEALGTEAIVVDRSDRGAVAVTGAETFSFLQSLLSVDVDDLRDGEARHALLLTPQGKLDVDLRVLRVGDDAWLDCEPGYGQRLAASLERFRIRVKAEIVDRTGEWGCVSVRGPGASAAVAVPDGARLVPMEGGFDAVGPRDALVDTCQRAVGPDVYDAWRIEAGIPRQGFELDEKTIPQEAFLERDAVSFTKGCFLGQEVVCRIDTRGHVNRFLRALREIEGPVRPPRGAEVVVDDRVVGTVTSTVADCALPALALGYVRREVEVPAPVTLRWETGQTRAVAHPL